MWGVGIVRARFFVGGIAVNHRVHIARSHAEKQIRLTQFAEGIDTGPIGLGNDAYAVALCFIQASNQGHTKTRVIDVGIASDNDDVARIPTQFVHFGAGSGEKGRSTKALGPVFLIRKNRLLRRRMCVHAVLWSC